MSNDPVSDQFSKYEFHADSIWCPDFHQEVMMEWERPLMERMAAEACHNAGDVLEIGFGMGISAGCIQSHRPRSHTIVECHPQILARLRAWAADKPNVIIVEGMWQDVLHTLGQYDGILWDTFGGVDSFSNRQMFPIFFEFVKSALRPCGRFTFFNPMPEPIATWTYGLDGVIWESIPVAPSPNEYYSFDTICMPVWTQESAAASGSDDPAELVRDTATDATTGPESRRATTH